MSGERRRNRYEKSAPSVAPNQVYGTSAIPMTNQNALGAPNSVSVSSSTQATMINAAGMSINPASARPNQMTFASSAFATPPPTKPATNGLTGIRKKCATGMGIAASIMAVATAIPFTMMPVLPAMRAVWGPRQMLMLQLAAALLGIECMMLTTRAADVTRNGKIPSYVDERRGLNPRLA